METLPDGLKDLIVSGVSVVAVIYGVLEAVKQAGWLPAKFAPVAAIAIGVGCAVANWLCPEPTGVVILGVSLGVAAGLFYAGFKRASDNARDAETERTVTEFTPEDDEEGE